MMSKVAPFTRTPLHMLSPHSQVQISSSLAFGRASTKFGMFGGVRRLLGVTYAEHKADSGDLDIPKLEPFSRSRLNRSLREPTILQKAEQALQDKCTTLDGDDAYKCWEALFEFENIKEEYEMNCDVASSEDKDSACRPLERFENMVRQSGGATSIIDNVRMKAKVAKRQKAKAEAMSREQANSTVGGSNSEEEHQRHHTPEDILQVDASLSESPFTRVLRRRGRSASWFTEPPAHEEGQPFDDKNP